MSDSWPWGIGQVGSGSEGESLMEEVVGVGIGWFASERHTYRQAVYCLKESAHPGSLIPARPGMRKCQKPRLIQGFTTVASFVLCNLSNPGELSCPGDMICFPP